MENNNIEEKEISVKDFPTKKLEVDINDVFPNKWNPNQQSEFIYKKLLMNIKTLGFTAPILVRELMSGYEIVDGEHRWRAAKELGYKTIPIETLGVIDVNIAKILTQTMNRIKGVDDVLKRAEMLQQMKKAGKEGLFELLPQEERDINTEMEMLEPLRGDRFKGAKPPSDEVDYLGVFLSKLINAENAGREWHKKTRNQTMRLMLETFFELASKFKEAKKE